MSKFINRLSLNNIPLLHLNKYYKPDSFENLSRWSKTLVAYTAITQISVYPELFSR